ncbi:MAG TPA: Mov34/MPN/PAD-1 family protein [Candidatus Angelobacter sp.]|nr:Mov34/MPN/PAD-1 family protein [Candidatus Angelobacter sp.]
MAKAAKVKIRVSTQPVVVMEAEVARKIRQHARSSMKAEVCGVLIGSTEHERMMVEACIQGNNAAQGGAHVTFTQDTWEHIYKIKDKEYPDQKIVGWYHSHPGFGVFLSEHDLFIQQNFFSNPQQVAWVYDPHTDEEGCFGWVGEKIEKLTAIRVGYLQNIDVSASGSVSNDYEDEDAGLDPIVKVGGNRATEEPAWVRWTSIALGYLLAVVLGVAGGFYLRSMAADVKIQGMIDTCMQLQWQPLRCQELLLHLVPQLGIAPASPSVQGQTQPGDQVSPAPPAQPSPAPQGQASPAPQVQVAPTPAKSPQNPKQEQTPAQKGNNAKH